MQEHKARFVAIVREQANRMDKIRRENRSSHAVKLAMSMDEQTIPPGEKAAAEHFLRLLYSVRVMPKV